MNINCNGKLIDLSIPKVMGIINCTPDSFFDGGIYKNETDILNKVEEMLLHGASFIDIGAYSSKPNAQEVTEQEELSRLLPVVSSILKRFPDILLSVDTFRSNVALEAVNNGVCIINDISAGLLDDNMMNVVAYLQVPYIMMHMKGSPQTMQSLTNYDDIIKEMLFYFSERVSLAKQLGINDLIIDPGFGFAKTIDQNFEILKKLEIFNLLDLPLLVGVSRKSMIYKTLDSTADNALNGTSALNMIALQKRASILRVHDVKEAQECILLNSKLK